MVAAAIAGVRRVIPGGWSLVVGLIGLIGLALVLVPVVAVLFGEPLLRPAPRRHDRRGRPAEQTGPRSLRRLGW